MSDQYSGNVDATDNQEPDYQSHFDKPIVLPDYELWSEQQETSIEEKERHYDND